MAVFEISRTRAVTAYYEEEDLPHRDRRTNANRKTVTGLVTPYEDLTHTGTRMERPIRMRQDGQQKETKSG